MIVLAPTHSVPSADPYAREKRQLATYRLSMVEAMLSLLPFVYEDRRAENQALFACALETQLPLDDPIWGRVAFVMGAYGNYMHRYPLSLVQKQQVWQAVLWSVLYERCCRRKYLTQRTQQLLHFLHGCADDSTFLNHALTDLEQLRSYLEVSSLKKVVEFLPRLPEPPAELLERLGTQLGTALEVTTSSPPEPNAPATSVSIVEKHSPAQAAQNVPVSSPPHSRRNGRRRENTHLIRAHQMNGQQVALRQKRMPLPASQEHEASKRSVTTFLALFMREEQCTTFYESLRAAQLERLNQLLQGSRRNLFRALYYELEMNMNICQEPRRAIRLGKKSMDRFSEARQLLESEHTDEQQRGLRLFEQGVRETTHPDYSELAREWARYARARVQGRPRVIDDWEQARQQGVASWEELWNLAAFYHQTGYASESLRILQPGIDSRHAPLTHLRLALTSALCLLLKHEGEQAIKSAGGKLQGNEIAHELVQEARTFLLAHLEHWPHPLCHLAWLALAAESHGPLHPRQQSQRLSSFQTLAEQQQQIPDPDLPCSVARLEELEDLLVRQARCADAWLYWINDYATRHPRTYTAWTQLADACEQQGRLDRAEEALQHLVEIQYRHDYAQYQEGTPPPRAHFLRRNLEKLFAFYQRHQLFAQASEAFTSCYPLLNHLWDAREPENRHLLTLTQTYLETQRRAEEQAAQSRRELSTREISHSRTMPLALGKNAQRVGIFIDYENIASFIARGTAIEEVGQLLVSYAARFGTVVCQWASASPQNLSNLADVRAGLEEAGFKVRLPRRELQFSPSQKNLADFALLECLSEAVVNERPDIYLIVSGDRDYYERICSLLDAGHIVRLLASTESQHLSQRYRDLEQQRARLHQETETRESDFFIDDLSAVLYSSLAQG